MSNKEISTYLNSNNIKTPIGKEYMRQHIGMYFYKLRKIERYYSSLGDEVLGLLSIYASNNFSN